MKINASRDDVIKLFEEIREQKQTKYLKIVSKRFKEESENDYYYVCELIFYHLQKNNDCTQIASVRVGAEDAQTYFETNFKIDYNASNETETKVLLTYLLLLQDVTKIIDDVVCTLTGKRVNHANSLYYTLKTESENAKLKSELEVIESFKSETISFLSTLKDTISFAMSSGTHKQKEGMALLINHYIDKHIWKLEGANDYSDDEMPF